MRTDPAGRAPRFHLRYPFAGGGGAPHRLRGAVPGADRPLAGMGAGLLLMAAGAVQAEPVCRDAARGNSERATSHRGLSASKRVAADYGCNAALRGAAACARASRAYAEWTTCKPESIFVKAFAVLCFNSVLSGCINVLALHKLQCAVFGQQAALPLAPGAVVQPDGESSWSRPLSPPHGRPVTASMVG